MAAIGARHCGCAAPTMNIGADQPFPRRTAMRNCPSQPDQHSTLRLAVDASAA